MSSNEEARWYTISEGATLYRGPGARYPDGNAPSTIRGLKEGPDSVENGWLSVRIRVFEPEELKGEVFYWTRSAYLGRSGESKAKRQSNRTIKKTKDESVKEEVFAQARLEI